MKTLSAMLGHVSAATTLDIYTHATSDMQHAAARKIDCGIGKVELPDEPAPQANAPAIVDFQPYMGKVRKPGTGCISQINDHLFEGRYSPTWIDGKKHARNVYAHIKPQIRPNTKQFYRNCMENHLFPALGDCPLEKLSTIQIQRAINEMSEHGRNHYYSHIPLKETTLSPRIVQGILGILRKSLDQAVAEKLILSNPAANCKAPKTVRKEMKVLPEELIGPYLHEAKQRGVFAPLYLELTSGLRRGELLALLWKDLNVKDRTLSVTKSVCRIDHQLVVSQPKTKNSLRLLTLPESTVQILVEEHEKHPDNPYMFPSPKTGEMLDPASFRAMHDRILEAIGAEHVRFHDMRHSHTSFYDIPCTIVCAFCLINITGEMGLQRCDRKLSLTLM